MDHANKHTVIPINKLNTCCLNDSGRNLGFCRTFNESFCQDCQNKHKLHNIVLLKAIKFHGSKLENYSKKIENAVDYLKEIEKIGKDCINYFEVSIINPFKRFIEINELQYKLARHLLDNYKQSSDRNKLCYEVIQNVSNTLKFGKMLCNELKNNDNIFETMQKLTKFLLDKDNYILKESNLNNYLNKKPKNEKLSPELNEFMKLAKCNKKNSYMEKKYNYFQTEINMKLISLWKI